MKRIILLSFLGLTIVTLIGGVFWFILNLEMPEAGIAPLGDISRARFEDLTEVGVVFPVDEGIPIRLTPEQIKQLYDRLKKESPSTSLLNRWGHPYTALVYRKKDQAALGGYYYHWAIFDLGKDGKLDESNDVFMVFASRP